MKKFLPGAAIGLALLAAPLLTSNSFFLHLLIMVLFWTLLGTAWNLLGGFAGQVSFGHATFLGVGAYTTMLLYLNLGVAPWFGILIGGALATLVALPIGLICFRLRGPYFALSTLAVAEIIRLIALNWESLTAGPMGVQITVMPTVQWFGEAINWESKPPFYYMVVALTAFAMGATWLVARSRLGAYLIAIREDADSAEAAGIDTTRTKVIALALSACIAGLAGGFYALYFRYIDPDAVFSIAISVEMVFIAVVGGLATTGGPIVGAIFLVVIAEIFRGQFQVGHLIFYGLLMMLVIRYMPEGIWGRLRLLLPSSARAQG
jgi:branched-chain amino acid transport system permease protein